VTGSRQARAGDAESGRKSVLSDHSAGRVLATEAGHVRYKRTVLATCCIPWSAPFEFDEVMFRRSVRGLLTLGMKDLYVFGTAGEGHAVSDPLFTRIVDAFLEEMTVDGATPMVGVISSSLATMRNRVGYCLGRGCMNFQFAMSGWSGAGPTELRSVFQELCHEFPEASFLHYNTARSGRIVLPGEYRELAEEFPNFVGTKYGAGDPEVVTGLLMEVPQLRHFFTELGFYYGSAVGPCGLLASISSTNPRGAWSYLRDAENGDRQALAKDFAELAQMMAALRKAVGKRPFVDGAYDKVLAKVLEPDFPLTLLPPQVCGAADAWERYRDFLETRLPNWLPERGSNPAVKT
jgi:dihydrodipicolinate synthase/N-acetylneuraminate lyase